GYVAEQDGIAPSHAANVAVAEVFCGIEELNPRYLVNGRFKLWIVPRVIFVKRFPILAALREGQDRGPAILAGHSVEEKYGNIVGHKDSLVFRLEGFQDINELILRHTAFGPYCAYNDCLDP